MKTGCISCTSGDGQNGGPIWWNTPITEEIQTKVMKKKAAAKDEDLEDALALPTLLLFGVITYIVLLEEEED